MQARSSWSLTERNEGLRAKWSEFEAPRRVSIQLQENLRRDKWEGAHPCVQYLRGEHQRDGGLFSVVLHNRTRGNGQKLMHRSSTWTWGRNSLLCRWPCTEQGAQKGCGVSLSGDIPLPRHSQRGWTRWSIVAPSNFTQFVILSGQLCWRSKASCSAPEISVKILSVIEMQWSHAKKEKYFQHHKSRFFKKP